MRGKRSEKRKSGFGFLERWLKFGYFGGKQLLLM
jgi:hypothetical protein